MILLSEKRLATLKDIEYELKSAAEHLEKALDKSSILTPGIRSMIRLELFRVQDILYYTRAQRRTVEAIAK